MGQKRLYPTLDLLRIVAISLTLMAHARGIVERIPVVRNFEGGLWLGVDLFMLISGWLLGGQLLREDARGMFDPRRFYVKRWLRTLPPYYFMLLMLYVFGLPRFADMPGSEYVLDTARTGYLHPNLPASVIITHLTFLQRYLEPNLYGVSWSLCVEEHFYLLLPLIVLALRRWPRIEFAIGLVVSAEVVALVCRHLTFTDAAWVPQQTHMRCHGLFVGLLLAWINLHRPRLWARFGKVAGPLAIFGVFVTLVVMASIPSVPSRWTYVGVPTVATWTLALIFLACVHEDSRFSRVSFPGLQYLGELTYSIYLVHDVLPRQWIGEHSGQAGVRGLILRLALVGGFSVLLHHVVERPALRFRDWVLRIWRAGPRFEGRAETR